MRSFRVFSPVHKYNTHIKNTQNIKGFPSEPCGTILRLPLTSVLTRPWPAKFEPRRKFSQEAPAVHAKGTERLFWSQKRFAFIKQNWAEDKRYNAVKSEEKGEKETEHFSVLNFCFFFFFILKKFLHSWTLDLFTTVFQFGGIQIKCSFYQNKILSALPYRTRLVYILLGFPYFAFGCRGMSQASTAITQTFLQTSRSEPHW